MCTSLFPYGASVFLHCFGSLTKSKGHLNTEKQHTAVFIGVVDKRKCIHAPVSKQGYYTETRICDEFHYEEISCNHSLLQVCNIFVCF